MTSGFHRQRTTCSPRVRWIELWDGRIAVLTLAEFPDDINPWIEKVRNIAVLTAAEAEGFLAPAVVPAPQTRGCPM